MNDQTKSKTKTIMKRKPARRFAALFCALLLLAALAGCGKAPASGGSEPSSNTENSAAPVEQSGAASNDTAPDGASGTLHMVTGREDDTGDVGAEDGYYYLDRIGNYANIRYIDYASAQDIFLSSRPEADHLSPEDDSYVEHVAGLGRVFPAGDKVFLLIMGNSFGSTANEEDLGGVWRMEASGAARTRIYTCDAAAWLSHAVAADGQHLYLVEHHMESSVLLRLDWTTGEAQTLCELPTDVSLLGACSDSLAFVNIEEEEGSGENGLPVRTNSILVYPLGADGVKTVYSWKVEAPYRHVRMWNDSLVVCDPGPRTVTLLNLADGSEQTAFPFAADIPQDVSLSFDGIFDDHLFFFDWENNALRTIDLTTGEWGMVTLYFADVDKVDPDGVPVTRPMWIVAESETQFLICRGEEYVERRVKNWSAPGTESTESFPQYQYALIDKEDYWNSVPNFTDVVFNG